MSAKRYARHIRGDRAEWLATLLLRLKGYRILARRYRSPVGEIDIVARRGQLIAFVEVKARASLDTAAHAITPRQQQRIIRAAGLWQRAHPAQSHLPMSFDVILMAPWRAPRHIKNAFPD